MKTIMWAHLTDYFVMTNVVKQGGVLSPILYTLYIKELLHTLQLSHIGYYIDNQYTLDYSDNIILLCPSIIGLNKMLRMCSVFMFLH